MPKHSLSFFSAGVLAFCVSLTLALKHQPCPLLGPYVPPPVIEASSDSFKALSQDFTKLLDGYIAAEDGDFGRITPSLTSFSIALFAGSNYEPEKNDPSPSFFEYHHTATHLSQEQSNKSVFAVGDVTQLFTTLALLIEQGDAALGTSIVEYLPQLSESLGTTTTFDPIRHVNWSDVTLGSLASHMAGIVRNTSACEINQPCSAETFLEQLTASPPIELPDTTPIYSHAAFQVLAQAMESHSGMPFDKILYDDIVNLLGLNNTKLLSASEELFGDGLEATSLVGEPASLGLTSTISDLAIFGNAILTSRLISPAETRRWLKPASSTSNLRNSVGRPWEIYHFGETAIDPIIDIFTKQGSVGRYSSYFGLAPTFDVGFVILAVNGDNEAPDLNAYADMVLYALQEIAKVGTMQANETLSGIYQSGDNSSTFALRLSPTDPNIGIEVDMFVIHDVDWLAKIAAESGVSNSSLLDMRLYPTDLMQRNDDGSKAQVFQAVIQDKGAPVDAGTPTCVSWMDVGEFQVDEEVADRFVVKFNENGIAVEIQWPALQVLFRKKL